MLPAHRASLLLSILFVGAAGCLAPDAPREDAREFTATYTSEAGELVVWARAGHRAMAANGSVVDALLVGYEASRIQVRFLVTPDLVPIQRITDCAPRVDDGCRYRYVHWFQGAHELPLGIRAPSPDKAPSHVPSVALEFITFGTVRVTQDPGLPFPQRFLDEDNQVWERTHFELGTPHLPYSGPASASALKPLTLPAPDGTYVWPFPGADQPLPGREHSIKTALEAYLEQGDHGFAAPDATVCVDHAAAALDGDEFTIDLSQGRTETRRLTMEWVPPSLLAEGTWNIQERDGPRVYPCATMGNPEPGTPWVRYDTMFDAMISVAEDVGEPRSAGLTRHERIGGRAWEPRYTMTIDPDWAEGQRTTALYKLDVTPDGTWYYAYVDPNPGMFSTALAWEK